MMKRNMILGGLILSLITPIVSMYSMKRLPQEMCTEIAKFGGPEVWKNMFFVNKLHEKGVQKCKDFYFGEKGISFKDLKKIDGKILRLYMSFTTDNPESNRSYAFKNSKYLDFVKAFGLACRCGNKDGYRKFLGVLKSTKDDCNYKWYKSKFLIKELYRNAARGGHKEIMKWIFDKFGKDVSADCKGLAFRSAASNNKKIKFRLKNLNRNELEFMDAASGGHLEKMKLLVDKFGKDIGVYRIGMALGAAAKGGRLEIVKWLVKKFEKDISAYYKGFAFMEAALGGHKDIMEWLLKDFGNDITGYHIGMAFQEAAKGGHKDIMEWMLKEFSKDITADYIGMAFIGAASGGHLEIVQLFLCEMPNEIQKTDVDIAIDLANKKGHDNIARWLEEKKHLFGNKKKKNKRISFF